MILAILAWIDTEACPGFHDHRRQSAVDLIVDNVEWQRLVTPGVAGCQASMIEAPVEMVERHLDVEPK